MVALSHYFEVKVCATGDRLRPDFNRIFQTLHAMVNMRDLGIKGRIALGFPDARGGRLGGRIRVFGNEASIIALRAQPAIRALARAPAFSISEASPIPFEAVTGHVVHRRDRSLDRRIPGKPRLDSRGHDYIEVLSRSSQSRYSLFVKTEPADHPVEGEFNGYGLSFLQDGGRPTVPLF